MEYCIVMRINELNHTDESQKLKMGGWGTRTYSVCDLIHIKYKTNIAWEKSGQW